METKNDISEMKSAKENAEEWDFSDEPAPENKKIAFNPKDYRLPESFPVRPLGKNGTMFYFLDSLSQFIEAKDKEINANFIRAIVGSDVFKLPQFFPKLDKDGMEKRNDWDATMGIAALMYSCAKKTEENGIFSPFDMLRGRGAWLGRDGGIVYHFGDKVFSCSGPFSEVWAEPGEFDGHVYAAEATLCKPAEKKEAGVEAVLELYKDLQTWNWRNKISARLFLGWIGAAFICGVLKWRPTIWVTGDKKTGKSTLMERALKRLFGNNILTTANSSEASIRQQIGRSTLPVAFDELESGADPRKEVALITLARTSASGTTGSRGGSDHNAVKFEIRSCFAFSSINIPPLKPQDRDRIAVLSLNDLTNETPPDFSEERLRKIGAVIHRRILSGWKNYDNVLNAYEVSIKDLKLDDRVVDQYGTLLACSHILLNDDVIVDDAEEMAEEIKKFVTEDKLEAGNNSTKCVEWLMSSRANHWRSGVMTTVGKLIIEASTDSASGDISPSSSNDILKQHGMKIVSKESQIVKGAKCNFLFVANSHQGLSRIFENTDWIGQAGTIGGWRDALRRLPGSFKADKTVRLDGWTGLGTYIPLEVLGITNKEEEDL